MSNEIKKIEIKQGNSPAEMIQAAITSGADLEKLQGLLSLQERWEANEAKKAYVQAMASFKEESPKITKDKTNKQYDSKYTSLSNLVNTVNPVLSRFGLSASWDIVQNGNIKVSCKVTHKQGHSEKSNMEADADTSGAKSKIQQIKSTITYLKAVTFESILGLASSDANLDDDGTGSVEKIDEKQLSDILDLLNAIDSKEGPFLKYLGIEKMEDLKKSDYKKALSAIEAQKKAKKS